MVTACAILARALTPSPHPLPPVVPPRSINCILMWALCQDWCPQCKAPFSYLITYRQLDGTLTDFPAEESVVLLKRAQWFADYAKVRVAGCGRVWSGSTVLGWVGCGKRGMGSFHTRGCGGNGCLHRAPQGDRHSCCARLAGSVGLCWQGWFASCCPGKTCQPQNTLLAAGLPLS
jgi:hypothetical protein